ncbi:MAG: hypothetical protein ACFFBV_15940, partial [Promethearchaeota archaeon]
IVAVEKLVNEQISKCLPVKREEMTVDEAKASGAQGVFDDKYGDKVSVYKVGNFSIEILGIRDIDKSPHSLLNRFKITPLSFSIRFSRH